MRKLFKLSLISLFGLFTCSSVNANVYRIDLNYGSDLGASGSSDGFIVIDTTETNASQIQQDVGNITPVPDWITSISLTYDPTPGNPASGDEVTKNRSTFRLVKWNLKTGVAGSFNLNNDWVGQMDGFGFVSTDADSTYGITNDSFIQNHLGSLSEFALESTTTTPGGLPLLGLGALAFYYKKIKKKFS